VIKTRRIFKTATTGQDEIRELLQFMFTGELLAPSDEFWLVSPWISDVVIIDNRSGLFSSLNPSWGFREIRLSEILSQLLSIGVRAVIVTRPGESELFLSQLNHQLDSIGLLNALTVILRENLHIKGVLCDNCLLTGSMNFTYYGLELNDEQVTFETDSEAIAGARIEFRSYGASS
jgi:phosphatidylserine/phosphatidylglycerophosphate/cardiolipin synthase-like enzyme